MNTIWKYPLAVEDRQTVVLPPGAELLTVQVQREEPQLWALVRDDGEYEGRFIRTYGTGHDVDLALDLRYVGTYQLADGDFVGHVFEEKPKQ